MKKVSEWSGDIDLHQGDTGTIRFEQVEDSIKGTMRVARGTNVSEHSIDGVWVGDSIRFTRHLDESSIQPFEGTVTRRDGDQAVMEGRFAAGLRGIWSATCRRTPSETPAPAGPSLTIRIKPYEPTERDRIEFVATASHPSGVRDITHHVNGAAVRTCAGERCVHVQGPFPAGAITWRVSARSVNGGENIGQERPITIKPVASRGNCRIIARADGPRAQSARVFAVSVVGPGNRRASRPFDANGRAEFVDLPEGRYTVSTDTRADIAVDVRPRRNDVECREGQTSEVVFDFR